MKFFVLLALAVFATANANDNSRYDNLDIDEALSNERLMISMVKCFLGEGPCTPEGADVKTMKFFVLLALAVFATANANDNSRYDNLDIDEALSNERLMISMVKCFLGEGPCTPEGADVKKLIPDALQNRCEKCSKKQKIIVARTMDAVIKKLPEEWKRLKKLYNPGGKYDETIKEFVKEHAN